MLLMREIARLSNFLITDLLTYLLTYLLTLATSRGAFAPKNKYIYINVLKMRDNIPNLRLEVLIDYVLTKRNVCNLIGLRSSPALPGYVRLVGE